MGVDSGFDQGQFREERGRARDAFAEAVDGILELLLGGRLVRVDGRDGCGVVVVRTVNHYEEPVSDAMETDYIGIPLYSPP